MKEVMAVIRINMINKTKEALLQAGFSSVTCRKVLGRGKKKIDFSLIKDFISPSEIDSPQIAEQISEGHRLVPKRMLTMVIEEEQVEKAVQTIIDINSTGNPGDGKIFVLPVMDAIRVRTGETGEEAI
mgnify:CR=1 FL=1